VRSRIKKRAVVVMSGGPDSSTAAYWAKSQGYEVYGITFKYGQIASKETEHAKLIAKELGIDIKEIDISSLNGIFESVTTLCNKSFTMPSKFEPSIIVPFRNAIFLSIAVAYAISVDAKTVIYGAHASDRPFYPDCREEFIHTFNQVVKTGTDNDVTIIAPFIHMEKWEIIRLGAKLGVPYELTWSCYLDGPIHCGKCESCVNRKNAFKKARVPDPTKYKDKRDF
jgi:7-cyano-7-deazaguanine synthase